MGQKIDIIEPWYSATDLSKTFGHSHQYWSKLLKQGKIEARKTRAGFITTHSWLLMSGFINKEKVNGDTK